MGEVLIVVGSVSLALLWIFAAFGGLMSVWDTFGDHVGQWLERFKR